MTDPLFLSPSTGPEDDAVRACIAAWAEEMAEAIDSGAVFPPGAKACAECLRHIEVNGKRRRARLIFSLEDVEDLQ
jgi:hypothetical protein